MILVQISDTHIDSDGVLVYGQWDTAAALERAIEAINALTPRPALVLHTGDIASHGSTERYARFQRLVERLEVPLALIPGNHDARQPLRESFGGSSWLPSTGEFLHYVLDDYPVRIICCDSVIDGETPGEMCPARLAWLSDRLDEAPTRPTIIALHHPPFYTGMTGTTAKGLKRGGAELGALIANHPQVVRILAGHVHRPITAAFANTIAFAAPSTCYPFGLDVGPERVLTISQEPPAVAVHLWLEDAANDEAGLVTHVLPIGSWAPSTTLLRDGVRVLSA